MTTSPAPQPDHALNLPPSFIEAGSSVLPHQRQFILGIDIGGTKIDAQLFEVVDGHMFDEPCANFHEKTIKGVTEHVAQVTKMIASADDAAHQLGGELLGIGIGSPGRFKNGQITPGSNSNLGGLHEFDNVNLKQEYSAILNRKNKALAAIPLYVANDGDAMLAGTIDSIRRNKLTGLQDQFGHAFDGEALKGKHVALLGIGTGLGHGIVDIAANGSYHFVTDGHASKLRVKVDDADWPMVEKAIARIPERREGDKIIFFDDHTVRAEDLCRGPVIEALANVKDASALDPENPEHAAVLKFVGKYVGRLIELIHSGDSQDVEPNDGWSAEDKAEAAQTSVYLVGGGVGRRARGADVIRYAQEELAASGVTGIQLVQATGENQAVRAAAKLVPESICQRGVGQQL